jgi:hypothetical protein
VSRFEELAAEAKRCGGKLVRPHKQYRDNKRPARYVLLDQSGERRFANLNEAEVAIRALQNEIKIGPTSKD